MRSKWIFYLLIATLSVQFIPLKEVGKLFYKNTILEEVCEGVDLNEKINELSEDYLQTSQCIFGIQNQYLQYFQIKPFYFLFTTRLLVQYSFEIPTPPPLISA